MMFTCKVAPNRFRRMSTSTYAARIRAMTRARLDGMSVDDALAAASKAQREAFDQQQADIRTAMKDEFPDHGAPVGLVFIMDRMEEYLVWTDRELAESELTGMPGVVIGFRDEVVQYVD